jgi:radical SAM superfamily enzyme YgiQ (UPF0313 family)
MKYLFPLNPYNQQRQFQKPAWVYPCHLAAYATYLRNEGHEVIWGNFYNNELYGEYKGVTIVQEIRDVTYKSIENDTQIDVPFEKLPFPDREFTDAKNPRWQTYGNYKFHPATHMMASNLCWWGKCTFCIDTAKLEGGEKRGVRRVGHVIEEIDDLIRLGFKEVFDDSGTFPMAKWLEEFCSAMIASKRNKKIVFGCNLKPIKADFKMMKQAGFRFVLVGVESANQETLDRIKKGQKADEAIEVLKAMNDAGLEVHLTSMFGYPWESHADAMRTVNLIHFLLKKGYVKTAQASVYMPPRTAPDANSPNQKYVQMVYDVYKNPVYWFRKLRDIKRIEDLTYLLKRIPLIKKAE